MGGSRKPKFILEDGYDDHVLQNKNQYSWVTRGQRILDWHSGQTPEETHGGQKYSVGEQAWKEHHQGAMQPKAGSRGQTDLSSPPTQTQMSWISYHTQTWTMLRSSQHP